jgi:hypothetical protein
VTQLDYATQPPPWYRRQDVLRWLRRIFFLLAGFLLIYVGYRAYMRVSMRYWQGRAMRYSAPADQVVFEEEPAAASKFVAKDRRYHRSPMHLAFAGYVPAEFQGLRPNWEPDAVAFLHERRAGGTERIVSVEVGVGQAFNERHEVSLYALVIEPDALGAPKVVGRALLPLPLHSIDRGRLLSEQPLLRLYAGQRDSADPSHFTIRYELGGEGGAIDGWLRVDNSVSLKVRDGPALTLTSSPGG